MKNILELIVKNLVKKQDEVSISESLENNVIIYNVKVNPEDMGKVIGKDGKIAFSIRTLIKAIASANKKKVVIKFD